jgi:general secretion pathway protein F
MLVAIVASGESSGRLAPALGRAAHELERELDALVSTLVAWSSRWCCW